MELEKDSAPFEDQLIEAAKFVAVDLDELKSSKYNGEESVKQLLSGSPHGREEWLLRWLLKKLQSSLDVVPR